MADYSLRSAQESDAASIRRLVMKVGINPTGLDWRRFVVATARRGQLIGCGQLKPHGRRVLELASIAVEPEYRRQGVASAIILRLLETPERPLYLMCRSVLGSFYQQFGFVALTQEEMPTYFRRLSKLAGLVESLAHAGDSLLVMKLK